MAKLWLINLLSRRVVVGDTPVVVTLTTYGARSRLAFYSIESIARGSRRPRRLILWLDDEQLFKELPRSLLRLRRRGLEIKLCAAYGPHNKQYPYAQLYVTHEFALVTADDDQLYKRSWLMDLVIAFQDNGDVINCFRSRDVKVLGDRLRPYSEWPLRTSTEPSLAALPNGVSGVIYPPSFLETLSSHRAAFMQIAPRADDIWIHRCAVEAGLAVRQIATSAYHPWSVPGTQTTSLFSSNVEAGNNDVQVLNAYTASIIQRLRSDAE